MKKLVRAAQTGQALSLAALEEASRQGLREADIEHLLLAVVLSDQGAGRALRELGIDINSARRAVREQHQAQLSSLGVDAELPAPGRIVFHETSGYDLTKRAADLIGRAAGRGRDGDASDVLRELVAEPSGLVDSILHRLGTTPADVLGRLEQTWPADPPAPRDPAKTRRRTSTETATFVPAAVDQVWEFVSDPARVPEWGVGIGVGSVVDGDQEAIPGTVWRGQAPKARPDGAPMKIRPSFQRRDIELVDAQRPQRVAWCFTYPDAPRSRPVLVEFALGATTGGTRLGVTISWSRAQGWRRLVG